MTKKRRKDNITNATRDVVATGATSFVGMSLTNTLGGMVPASPMKTSVMNSTMSGIKLANLGGTTIRGAQGVLSPLRDLARTGKKKRRG